MKIINVTKDKTIAQEVKLADNFWQRLIGLLGHKELKEGQGLIIKPCKIVHTFFMNFAIDLVFVDEQGQIVDLVTDLKPNRISPFVAEAEQVIELASGIIRQTGTEIGEKIKIENYAKEN